METEEQLTKKVNTYFKNILPKKHILREIIEVPIQKTMTEKINILNATYFLHLSQDFLDYYVGSKHNGKGIVSKVNTNNFRQFLFNILQNKGQLEIDYEYGKNLNLGRIYTKNCSLQRLNCNIKHFLTENLYDDVDMVNSHPTIILCLGDMLNIHSPTLEEYINNRSNFLKENNLEKTTIIIKGCYNDVIDNYATGKPRRLYEEIQLIRNRYYNIDELKEVFSKKRVDTDKAKPKKDKPRPRGRPISKPVENEEIEQDIDIENIKSSFFSNLLGYLENKIINYVAQKNNLTMRVNMYDGFLADKNSVDIDKLNLTTKDLKIKWSKKKMNFEVKRGLEEFNYSNSQVYNQKKEEFEKEHFFIKNPFQVITKINNKTTLSSSYRNFKEAHSNILCQKLQITFSSLNKNINLCNFVDAWRDDPNRREYEKAVYIPYTCKETNEELISKKIIESPLFYNSFDGFDRRYIEDRETREQFKNDIEFVINEFLLKIISNNCKVKQNYLLQWIAHLVQRPRELPQIALVIFGLQGTGKNQLFNLIKGLIELDGNKKHSFVSTGKPEQTIFNRFNDCISNKILLMLNEFGKKNHIEIVDRLKPLITDDIKTIELKNVNGIIQEKNFSRVIIISDKESPLTLTTEERRYFIVKTSPEWRDRDKPKFGRLIGLLENDDFMNCLFSYFMDYDISTFLIGQEGCPKTEEGNLMVEDNIKAVHRFLKEEFIDGYENYKSKLQKVKKFGDKMGIVMVNSKTNQQLIEKFRNWLKENNYTTEYKNWNNTRYRTQLREAKGIYGLNPQFQVKINGKTTQTLFIVIDEIKNEINRIMPSVKNEEIIDDIDASKISSDSSTNTTIFSDSDSGSDFDTSIYN